MVISSDFCKKSYRERSFSIKSEVLDTKFFQNFTRTDTFFLDRTQLDNIVKNRQKRIKNALFSRFIEVICHF